ncbi:MAG: PD40 domain-containing protein [Proteobacteria bacterium]|nr:PD40 domain-containing protein [Pseudomonadota bacterium]
MLDFGLAKLVESTTAGPGGSATMSPTVLGTVAGQIMGTAGYMAPEQVDGGDVDHRADLFAFGCLLYEITSGRQPFRGKNMIETLNRITNVEPEGLKTIDGALPAELQRILDKCLAKNPAARYQTAGDLAVDLRGLTTAVETGRAAPLSSVESAFARGVSAAVAAALVVAALAVGSIATWLLKPDGPRPTRLRRASIFIDDELFGYAGWSPIALSPDGSRLAYLTSEPGKGAEGIALWVRAMDQLDGVKLAESARGLAFSPDGNWLAFRGPDDRLRKVPVTGGASQTIVDNTDSLRGLSWGPDGDIVYAPRAGLMGLFAVPATGGEPRRLTVPEAESHRWPHHLPDGSGLIYTSVDPLGSTALVYLDLGSGESKRIRENGSDGRYLPTGHLLWANNGALYAASFDTARQELSGAAVPVVEQVRDAPNGAASYSVGEDGTLVYMRGRSADRLGNEIAWFGMEDSIVDGGTQMNPTLSPNGGQLAYTVHEDNESALWTLDLELGVPTRLTFDRGRVGVPVWSSDGRQIYFAFIPTVDSSDEGVGLEQTLDRLSTMRVAADGSSAPVVVTGSEGYAATAIAPDDSFLVVVRNDPETQSDVLVLPLVDDRGAESLATSPAVETWASISPDGRWIAYAANPDANWSIYVRPWPRTGAVRQIPSNEFAAHPRWSHDGRTLYYRTNAGVMATPVVAQDGALGFGAPALVTPGLGGIFVGRATGGYWYRDYDVGPDGRVIVVRLPNEVNGADAGHVIVVHGWLDEVARLVAEGQ